MARSSYAAVAPASGTCFRCARTSPPCGTTCNDLPHTLCPLLHSQPGCSAPGRLRDWRHSPPVREGTRLYLSAADLPLSQTLAYLFPACPSLGMASGALHGRLPALCPT